LAGALLRQLIQRLTAGQRAGKANGLNRRMADQFGADIGPENHIEYAAGKPHRTTARTIASAVSSAVAIWPGWAFTTTGQPAASAEAVSPPGGKGQRKVAGAKHRHRP
jgi:hypothetical protein